MSGPRETKTLVSTKLLFPSTKLKPYEMWTKAKKYIVHPIYVLEVPLEDLATDTVSVKDAWRRLGEAVWK